MGGWSKQPTNRSISWFERIEKIAEDFKRNWRDTVERRNTTARHEEVERRRPTVDIIATYRQWGGERRSTDVSVVEPCYSI